MQLRGDPNRVGAIDNIYPFGVYDAQSRELDKFVYEHRDMLICFSAGNDGVDRDANGQVNLGSVTPPGTVKNCLTVGASENDRPGITDDVRPGLARRFPAHQIKSDRVADNASSRPTCPRALQQWR